MGAGLFFHSSSVGVKLRRPPKLVGRVGEEQFPSSCHEPRFVETLKTAGISEPRHEVV